MKPALGILAFAAVLAGGSAVDAAIATAMGMPLVEPQSNGMGD